MVKFECDVKFIDATEWTYLSWYNSGGTRAKRILLSPIGDEFYFKRSEKKPAKEGKPAKYYKYEFWSEIIAYQLGKYLGLDILRYDVAIHNGEIGCISPKMIKQDVEQLLEVGRYMTAINPEFLPENTKTRNEYTFELLDETLEHFKLTEYWTNFFETIIFDSIIGNTDRHQENWAFIGKNSFISEALEQVEGQLKGKRIDKMGWFNRKIHQMYFDKDKNEFSNIGNQIKLLYTNISKVAPIYDSGSSMARELNEDRIKVLLNDNQEFNKYVVGGKAEIHWQKRKISHFELIENLINSAYLGEVVKSSGFIQNWDNTVVHQIVYSVDKDLPDNFKSYCIPMERKELIVKLLISRFEKLKKLLGDRV